MVLTEELGGFPTDYQPLRFLLAGVCDLGVLRVRQPPRRCSFIVFTADMVPIVPAIGVSV